MTAWLRAFSLGKAAFEKSLALEAGHFTRQVIEVAIFGDVVP